MCVWKGGGGFGGGGGGCMDVGGREGGLNGYDECTDNCTCAY